MTLHHHLILYILAMGGVIVLSNILVQYQLGNWLTYGALTYPFVFLITDLATRFKGAEDARRMVFFGFMIGIVCSAIVALFDLTTMRIATASAVAFIVAQLIDVEVFDRLRHLAWWKTPAISSSVGSVVDTFLFFSIAFSATTFALSPDANVWAQEIIPFLGMGPATPLWVSLAVADLGVKALLILILLIPYRWLTANKA